jgi:hypothetical protein
MSSKNTKPIILSPRPILLSQKVDEHPKPKTLSQASYTRGPKSHEHPKPNILKKHKAKCP